MEMLSVMFFGMAISGFFTGLLKPAMDAYGVFDLWNVMLLTVFIPVLDLLFPIFLSIMEWFMNLPDGVKKVIGIIAVLGVIFGIILGVVGAVVLGFGGLAAAWGFFLTILSPSLIIFGVLVAVVLFIIGIVQIFQGKLKGLGLVIMAIGIIIFLFVAWWGLLIVAAGAAIYWLISNWTKVKEFFKNILNSIKDFFIKTFGVDIIGYIFNLASKFIDFGKSVVNWIVSGISSIAGKIWNAILGGFGMAKNFVSSIFGGMKGYGDVIWRPGSAPIAVSPNDTITATKGGGMGGGFNYSPTYYVNVADKNEFQRMIELNNRKMVEDIRRITET